MQNENRSLDDFQKFIYISMRKINDTKELNEIYSQINTFIQQYIESHNILPSEIYKYVKKNMNRFLEKNNLKDIEKIDQIVEDVIKHRFGMERDQVMPFSKFSKKLNESLLQTSANSVEQEKILADYYNTSLGHVHTIDPNEHLYEIEDFGESKKVIIYSEEQMSNISENITEKIFQELKMKSIALDSLDGIAINMGFDFLLEPLIDESKYKENIKTKMNKEVLIRLISSLISTMSTKSSMVGIPTFTESFKGHYIWEL
jgi:hypothetical protein